MGVVRLHMPITKKTFLKLDAGSPRFVGLVDTLGAQGSVGFRSRS